MKPTTFEYSIGWRSICRRTYQILPRCTCNPLHKASAIHHVQYKRSPIRRILGMLLLHAPHPSVSGLEIPGWDVFPVCAQCHDNYYGRSSDHRSVHYAKVWIQRGGLDNHNIVSFAWRLRIKFWVCAIIFHAAKFVFFAFFK